jgi:Protein of unknown function (DUF2889)
VSEVAGPSVTTPARVPGSTRRTTSIEMDMAHGQVLVGRARDLVTPRRGDAVVVDEASFTARIGEYRLGQAIEEIGASPGIDGLDILVGRSAARGYRRELQRLADEQGLVGRAIYQLLDDVPGASLVAGYSPELNRRDADRGTDRREVEEVAAGDVPEHLLALTGVCAGWQEGGAIVTNVLRVGHVPIALGPEAPSLDRADDPLAWHEMPGPIPPHGMRRRRRIDVIPAPDGRGLLKVDAMFRDSYVTATGVETIVHEYTFTADVDPRTHVVLASEAVPRALPFAQCPEAGASAGRLVGNGLDDLRARIRAQFVGPTTCTHLNDMLRALADVGVLAARVGAVGADPS